MKLFLLLFVALLFPELAWAQSPGSLGQLSLSPPDTDLSIVYLSNIFGVVGTVLSGSGSQLLGKLFLVFNSAVLVLGGIVILYTLIVSTLNTAHEGEVLGKRWSSIWIPLRSVIGIGLLIPNPTTGYCFIQIFIMWVVVQGVGAADSVWNTALDYLTTGGVVIQQNQSSKTNPTTASLVTGASNLLRSLTCMSMLQAQFQAYQQNQVASGGSSSIDPPPNFYQGVLNQFANLGTSGSGTIQFPGSDYYQTNGVCGSVSWDPVTLPSFMQNSPQYNNTRLALQQSRTNAIQQMISSLYPVANAITNNYMALPAQQVPLGQITDTTTNPPTWGSGSTTNPNYLLPGNTLSNTAATYFGTMSQALNLNSVGQNSYQGWLTKARSQGWILAGQYYYNLVAINDGVKNLVEDSPPSFTPPQNNLTQVTNITNYLGGSSSSYVQAIQGVVNSNANIAVGASSPFINGAQSYGSALTYGAQTVTSNKNLGGAMGQILNVVTGGLYSVITGFMNLFSAQSNNVNPIIAMATVGSGLITATVTVFVILSITTFGIAMALAAAWGFAFPVAINTLVIPLMGLLNPVLLALLVTGFILTFYIPMIPFIYFTFGALGWIIAVIEGVIAAPIVALGIAHPEGQEILGKAEPAVVLLVNIFLRPTLMIFGFLIGMMLSYVGIWLLNAGFISAFSSYSSKGVQGFAYVFYYFAQIVLYTIIAMQIVQKSFTLISVIPDEVLKWIGGNIKGMGGEADAERTIAGQAHGAAKSGAAEGISGLAQSSKKAGSSLGKIPAKSSTPGLEASGDTGGNASISEAGKGADSNSSSGSSAKISNSGSDKGGGT